MARLTDALTRWRGPILALAIAGVLVGGFVVSLARGTPSTLPSIAMGSALLLHLIRAAVAAALVGGVVVVVLRLWRGELPTKLSTTGAEWAAPVSAPDRAVQEQLLQVDRESKAAIEELARRVEELAQRVEERSPRQSDGEDPPTLQLALDRWSDALTEAEKREATAEAFNSLTARERLVIALSAYEGLTDREVAEVLAIAPTSVRTIRTRARRKLESLVGAELLAVPHHGDRGGD